MAKKDLAGCHPVKESVLRKKNHIYRCVSRNSSFLYHNSNHSKTMSASRRYKNEAFFCTLVPYSQFLPLDPYHDGYRPIHHEDPGAEEEGSREIHGKKDLFSHPQTPSPPPPPPPPGGGRNGSDVKHGLDAVDPGETFEARKNMLASYYSIFFSLLLFLQIRVRFDTSMCLRVTRSFLRNSVRKTEQAMCVRICT